jgi:hypothetical protein
MRTLAKAILLCQAVISVACSVVHGADTALSGPAELVLVKDGQPVATIVTAASPSDNARVAAAELQEFIEKISGARLPVVGDDSASSGTLILVGRSKLTDQIADLRIPAGRTRNLNEEGFVIRTQGDRLVLAGNDEKPYLGTRYAVIQFLHGLGVRWFMPGEIGEVVPRTSSISIRPMNVTQRPDFPVRDFWEHARGNMAREEAEWKVHNMMNPDSADAFGIPTDGSVGKYLPKDQFDAHPDWFALNHDGTRAKDHPCTTSEEMIQYFVEKVKAEARKGRRVSAFAPVDGNPRCWCDRCARIGNSFDGYGANERDPVPESSASNEWFYFVNRILTEVNKEFPDYLIATNGYANRDIPPEMPPDVVFNPSKNLVVMFANIGACTIHAYDDPKCWQMKRQGEMLQGFCKLCDKVWIYNYNYTMLINKGTLTPMVHRIRRNIPLLKKWGLLGFYDQDEADLALTGIPTRLVRARLEWDTKADVDAILDDFFTKWFGPAGEPMKAYYAALEDAFDKTTAHGHEDIILPLIYTDALMAKLDECVRAAESAARSDTVKTHMQMERAMYDLLREYVAMFKAERKCEFAEAAVRAGKMLEIQQGMTKFTPFMGWHAYRSQEAEWEQKRMKTADAMLHGPTGELIALLPEPARFRVDPYDDGRYERWQDLAAEAPAWRTISMTAGWESQGLQDEQGHPYKGVAWYQFDVDVPADARGKNAFLHAMAVVNEAWVWVNGKYAGHKPYKMVWSRPQALDMDVSKLLVPGKTNRITVRALCNFDVWGANGIYERLFLYDKKPAAEPAAEKKPEKKPKKKPRN